MKTLSRQLFAIALLVSASALWAQNVSQTITNSAWTPVSTSLGTNSGDRPSGNDVVVPTSSMFGYPTFANSISGTTGAPSNASALLSNNLTTYTNDASFGGEAWISFSAQRTGSTSAWTNLKLLQGADQNSGIVLGIGSVGLNNDTTNWGAGEGRASSNVSTDSFSSAGLIGAATSQSTAPAFFLIRIDYNANGEDSISIWRSATAITQATALATAAGWTNTGDYAFTQLGVYAGAGATLAFSDISLQVVPEPSTCALLFGGAVLGLAVGRRCYGRRLGRAA